jgi:hypothetical protein
MNLDNKFFRALFAIDAKVSKGLGVVGTAFAYTFVYSLLYGPIAYGIWCLTQSPYAGIIVFSIMMGSGAFAKKTAAHGGAGS